MNDQSGRLHRHEDGTEHRHFKTGSSFGGRTSPDKDGSQEHYHGSLTLGSSAQITPRSGPVVWVEDESTPKLDGDSLPKCPNGCRKTKPMTMTWVEDSFYCPKCGDEWPPDRTEDEG